MSIQVDRTTRSKIIAFLVKHFQGRDFDRFDLVEGAFFDTPLQGMINMHGDARGFASEVFSKTYRYGEIEEGYHALVAVLEAVGSMSGVNVQKEVDAIVKEIAPTSKTAIAPEPVQKIKADVTDPKVFISYKREDEPFARKLARRLTDAGVPFWMDVQDIRAAEKWNEAIQRGLDASDLMLLIVSPEAMASPNVADEWEYYHSERKPIIPVYYKKTKMPFQLNRIQRVDFRENFDAAVQKLLQELTYAGVMS